MCFSNKTLLKTFYIIYISKFQLKVINNHKISIFPKTNPRIKPTISSEIWTDFSKINIVYRDTKILSPTFALFLKLVKYVSKSLRIF